jgi:uncharacterized protein (TIGR02996 family)
MIRYDPVVRLHRAHPMQAYWRPNTVIAPPLETSVIIDTVGNERRVEPLAGEMTIGRVRGNDIVLDRDVTISRKHARLRLMPEGLVVEDIGSAGGIAVGGRRCARHLLHVGEVLLLGHSRISFEHTLAAGPALPDEAARLLASVCAAPDDDEPRLVLADWLTARGDPRGEFIAYQIAAEAGVNTRAHDLAEALLATHELAWVGPLPVPVVSWTFRRGFLDCVWVQPERDVQALRAYHPLRAAVLVERP